MRISPKAMIRAAVMSAVIAAPGTAVAGGDFSGVWQPYSGPVEWLGAMTVAPDSLSFAEGPQAQLEPVREGGSVFRLIDPQGETFRRCGPEPVNYVGFHVLDSGRLARLYYKADTPPAEPTGSNSQEVTRNGACSVMFYAR